MIKNYIKLALKVMLRKKYYTMLSLVGISFTIMIITVFASFIDQVIGESSSEPNRSRTLILDKVSIYNGGKAALAPPGIHLLKQHVADLESTEAVAFIANKSFVSYQHQKATGHMLIYADENFWKITRFNFLEGRSFQKREVEKADRVVVINKRTKEHFFGDRSAAGKELIIYGQKFTVIGVVDRGAAFSRANADMYLPYSTDEGLGGNENGLTGYYAALLLARSGDLKKVRAELRTKMKMLNNKISGADSIKLYAFTPLEQFAKSSSYNDLEPEYGKTALALFIVMLLFMLIPAISLINLNLSRIGERAEEIGVRKSFGATSGTLVKQLVVENVIVTLVGGLIGLALATYTTGLLVHILNSFDPLFKMPANSLSINWRVVSLSLFSCFVFGLISGVYPAWKLSRLNPVYALKGGRSHD